MNTITLNDRSRQRILLAASSVVTKDERDAAVIGGIAQALLRHGSWNTSTAVAASQHAQAMLSDRDAEGNEQMLRYFQGDMVFCKRGPVTTDEMRTAVRRFMIAYENVKLP